MSMSTGNQLGKIACPHCGAMIKSPGLATGAAVNCPKCGQAFRIGQEAVQSPRSKVQGEGARETQDSSPKVRGQQPSVPQPPPPPDASSPLPGGKRTDAER